MENMGENLKRLMDRNQLNKRYQELMKQVKSDPDVQRFIAENRDTLTEESIQRSSSKLYEFVQEKKKFQEKKGMMAPGYRPELMLNQNKIDITYIPTPEFVARQKENQIRNRIQSIAMPKNIQEVTLADVDITEDRHVVMDKVFAFIENYLEAPKKFHKGLYLEGPFGVGKTYLLGAVAHELAENGFSTTLVHFPTFAVEMKQSIGDNTTGEKINAIKSAPILMLDDIGADSMSSWIRDDVLGVILQHRMQEALPTFFSSNFSMKQLEEEHLTISQRGEDEPLKAKRIMERIRFLAEEVSMDGKNRRHSG